MAENNEIKDSLEKTIDSLFTDTPGAPVSSKPVAPKAAAPAAPKAAAPAAPAAPKAAAPAAPAAPKAAAPAAPKAAAPAAPAAPKAAAPAAPAAPKAAPAAPKASGALTVSELKKLINTRPEPRPMEKTPGWSIILTVCAMIISMSLAGVAIVAAYFYFGPGSPAAEGNALLPWIAMVMCFVVCAVVVGFVVACAFMLRKMEKDIREIKSKL